MWRQWAQPKYGRKIKSFNTSFSLHFGLCFLWSWPLVQLQNEETRSYEWFKLSAKLWLSALTSHTCHQACRSSPRWWPPDFEFLANLEENFIGLESSSKVGSSVSNLPLYNPSVGKKKNPAILEWTSPLNIFSKFNPLNRDHVNAEIAHFHANEMQKMNH